jgi:hypothetical protein
MVVETFRRAVQVVGVLLLSWVLGVLIFNHVAADGPTANGWRGTLGELFGPGYLAVILLLLYKAGQHEFGARWTEVLPSHRRVGRKVVRMLVWLWLAAHVLFAAGTLVVNLIFRRTFSLAATSGQARHLTMFVADAAIAAVILRRTRGGGQPTVA